MKIEPSPLGGGGRGGGVHSILRCHNTFQKKVAQLNNYESGGRLKYTFSGSSVNCFFPKILNSGQ